MDTALGGILEVALQQGIWAALYIYLFFRMLKENAQREEKYQNMIDEPSKERLSPHLIPSVDNKWLFVLKFLCGNNPSSHTHLNILLREVCLRSGDGAVLPAQQIF